MDSNHILRRHQNTPSLEDGRRVHSLLGFAGGSFTGVCDGTVDIVTRTRVVGARRCGGRGVEDFKLRDRGGTTPAGSVTKLCSHAQVALIGACDQAMDSEDRVG